MLKKLKTLKLPKLKLPQSIKLPKFSKSSKSTEPEDSDFSELPQPTKSLKSFTFDKKNAAKAASSVVLFGFSGWFLWQTFLAVPESPPPPSLPQAVATIDPTLAMQPPLPVVESVETAEDSIEPIEELLVAVEAQEETNEALDQVLPDTQQALMEMPDFVTEQLEPDVLHETAEFYDAEPATETTILASTPALDETPQKAHPYMLTARSNLDARDCLSLTENMDIHRCAENFR